MARVCIFCNKSSVLTREHVYPDWLSAKFGARVAGHSKLTGTVEREWAIPIFQQTVKVVCGDCNGGWMSELENSVKDFLGPMILEAKSVKLTKDLQAKLAFWVTKTMLVSHYVLPSKIRIIPATDYHNLFKLQKSLPNYGIHISYREHFPKDKGDLVATQQFQQVETIHVQRDEEKMMRKRFLKGGIVYGGSLIIGHVAFHLIGHNVSGMQLKADADNRFELPISTYSHDFTWPATFPIELMGGLGHYVSMFNSSEQGSIQLA